MAFWCKGKKDYCEDSSAEGCNNCKHWNDTGGIEIEDDNLDDIVIRQWISVNDRLPEDETPVLVGYSRNLDGFVCIGYLDHEDMRWCGLDDIRIARPSHWMPLPEPPKEAYDASDS